MEWADAVRRMKVRTNAETPLDAETARKFGAEGIGLCRTEHMFFDPERIGAVRQMIMANDERGRRAALARLLPFQRKDFVAFFSPLLRGRFIRTVVKCATYQQQNFLSCLLSSGKGFLQSPRAQVLN